MPNEPLLMSLSGMTSYLPECFNVQNDELSGSVTQARYFETL